MPPSAPSVSAKQKLLDVALNVIRAKGYAATSVDDLCAAAGVTKGAFFHHFKSKEDLGIAAADYWGVTTKALFESAPYHALATPFERIIGYLDYRKTLLKGELAEFTCLLGTMLQELHATSPAIREACERVITSHAATLEADIEAALRERGLSTEVDARSLALHTQTVIQGAFILAKARNSADIAAESIDHLIRYFRLLLTQPDQTRTDHNDDRQKHAVPVV